MKAFYTATIIANYISTKMQFCRKSCMINLDIKTAILEKSTYLSKYVKTMIIIKLLSDK